MGVSPGDALTWNSGWSFPGDWISDLPGLMEFPVSCGSLQGDWNTHSVDGPNSEAGESSYLKNTLITISTLGNGPCVALAGEGFLLTRDMKYITEPGSHWLDVKTSKFLRALTLRSCNSVYL